MRTVTEELDEHAVLTYRIQEGEEVARDIRPIRDRIFHADEEDAVTDGLPQIFRDPRWKIVLVPGSICMPVRYGFANWDDGKYMTPEQLAWMFPPGCPEELVPFFDLLREEGCEEV